MPRLLRRSLWIGFAVALGASSCNDNTVGVGSGNGVPNGDLVATIVRTVRPDHPFYTIPFPPDPVQDQEQGTWIDDYEDPVLYALAGSGYFLSPDTGAQVPLLVQVGSSTAGASVRAAVDQQRGTLGVFGLLDLDVWIEVRVYRLR